MTIGLSAKTFASAFTFLLENMYVTAFKNGRTLNANWSTFVYSTSAFWEQNIEKIETEEQPYELLKEILTRTVSDRQFLQIVRTFTAT